MRHTLRIVPDQTTAPVKGDRIDIVADPVALLAQEPRSLRGPPNLHDTRRNDQRLVIPPTLVHLTRASDTFEGVFIASRLQSICTDLQILAHVAHIQHGVDVTRLHRFVRVFSSFDANWKEIINNQSKRGNKIINKWSYNNYLDTISRRSQSDDGPDPVRSQRTFPVLAVGS